MMTTDLDSPGFRTDDPKSLRHGQMYYNFYEQAATRRDSHAPWNASDLGCLAIVPWPPPFRPIISLLAPQRK